MKKHVCPLLLFPLVAGCAANSQKSDAAGGGGGGATKPQPMVVFPREVPGPKDARPEPTLLVSLTVYRIALPVRTVSHNEEFWKHVVETGPIEASTHNLLFANGLRVGIAPRDDWDYFRRILEVNPAVFQKTGATGNNLGATIEMPLKQHVLQQFVTSFHPANGLVGQMYDRSDNSIQLLFKPVPRQLGDIEVTVTPFIRAERTEIMYTVRNEGHELMFTRPEQFFHLGLKVEVPLNNFLIVAPSADADISSSIGHTFLHEEGPGQEYETVLLISPQPFQLGEPKAPATMPAAGPRGK
jgi:hypothetical protein